MAPSFQWTISTYSVAAAQSEICNQPSHTKHCINYLNQSYKSYYAQIQRLIRQHESRKFTSFYASSLNQTWLSDQL